MIIHRNETPRINDEAFANFADVLKHLKLNAIPKIVESSARAFIEAPTRSPLRKKIAKKAIVDVIIPEGNSKSNHESTNGTPVKSNFRYGSQGKGIFNPEYFME